MTAPGSIQEWITIGASVAGSRHRLRNEEKQDAMRVNRADDHLAIAAADQVKRAADSERRPPRDYHI